MDRGNSGISNVVFLKRFTGKQLIGCIRVLFFLCFTMLFFLCGCTERERAGYSAIPQNSPGAWEMRPFGEVRN